VPNATEGLDAFGRAVTDGRQFGANFLRGQLMFSPWFEVPTRTGLLDPAATSLPPGPHCRITHARIDAAIDFGSSLSAVMAWFLICRVPTLLGGSLNAA
jgi:hypothetical protein